MIYYTSDLHLCHVNVIMRNSRPFSDVEEMNETIIDNWNNRYHGSYHLFGHIHNNKISEIPCRFNVGVDVNDFFPVTLDELFYNK